MITNLTQLNAVIGFPLGHSRSPALHNAVYNKLGINAVMLPFAYKNIGQLISAIRALNIGLTAVTMPFKQSIIPFLDKIDSTAKAMKAVNTVINRNGKLFGYNTDVNGIARALKGVKLPNKNVLIIGAGGAARAAAFYSRKAGGKIFYFNRTASKAKKLVKEFGGAVLSPRIMTSRSYDVIINTTPVGMHPNINNSPLPKVLFKKNQHVFDLVYNPIHTKFLKEAKAAGAKTISGMDMFVGQALRQIELYSGKRMSNSKIYNFAKGILLKSLQL